MKLSSIPFSAWVGIAGITLIPTALAAPRPAAPASRPNG